MLCIDDRYQMNMMLAIENFDEKMKWNARDDVYNNEKHKIK